MAPEPMFTKFCDAMWFHWATSYGKILSVIDVLHCLPIPSNFKYKVHLRRQQLIDHSDVVGAAPVGAAPTTFSFYIHLTPGFNGLAKTTAKRDEKYLSCGIWCAVYLRLMVPMILTLNIYFFLFLGLWQRNPSPRRPERILQVQTIRMEWQQC